jgi:hypothetical protein
VSRSRETDEWGVGEKVSVDVASLEKLAQQIKDDMDTFHRWVEVWQLRGAETNPSNAQFTEMVETSGDSEEMPAGARFKEATFVQMYNNAVLYNQMRGLVLLMQMGVGSLASGATFLSEMYPGVDGYNNVQLSVVQDAFPPMPMKSPGDIGKGGLPGQGWTVAKDGKGWDTDGDIEGDTEVPFAASGGPPVGIDKGDSKMKPPKAVDGSTHDGYVEAIDTRPLPGGDLDGATRRDYENNKEEGESNFWLARGAEDAWDWTVETGKAIENVTDGENDPSVAGPW